MNRNALRTSYPTVKPSQLTQETNQRDKPCLINTNIPPCVQVWGLKTAPNLKKTKPPLWESILRRSRSSLSSPSLPHRQRGHQGRLSPAGFSPQFGVKSPAVPVSSAVPPGSSLLINTLGEVSLGANASWIPLPPLQPIQTF